MTVRNVESAESYCEAGSSWPREDDTTSADVTAVAKSVGEALPPGIAKYSATTESELAKLSAEDGSFESGAKGTTSAVVTAVAKSSFASRDCRVLRYDKIRNCRVFCWRV